MRVFSRLYNKMITWSRHHYAPYYLSAVSVAESSFFPLPPDIMLVPMAIASPKKAWWYALLTTLTSVFGALLGYAIGFFAAALVVPLLTQLGYLPQYTYAQALFQEWGFLAVIIAGFTPVPYKIFTITAGIMHMALLPFLCASMIGRGGRFFLVAAIAYFGGGHIDGLVRRYIDRTGWLLIAIVAIVVFGKFYH